MRYLERFLLVCALAIAAAGCMVLYAGGAGDVLSTKPREETHGQRNTFATPVAGSAAASTAAERWSK
jgi:hypothetical protein